MSETLDVGRTPQSRAYDPASLDYQEASEQFWKFLSLRTVEQIDLQPGGSVLDLACGPGVSTVSAAEAVGPEGRVIGFDSSAQMLRMTAERAAERGLKNVETELGDMARIDFPEENFDAVISVLGVFYLPDMPALISGLWKTLKPGGQLAITTLGEGAFQPAFGIWKEAVRAERSAVPLSFSWERTANPDRVRALFQSAGVPSPRIRLEPREVPIPTPADWWLAVMGSGMRRTVLEMDDETAGRVRAECDRRLREAGVTSIQVPGVYAIAAKS